MWDTGSFGKKYWFDPEVRERQDKEVSTILIYLDHLLEQSIHEKGPEDLKVLICEYIVNAHAFKKLMDDVGSSELRLNEKINKEQYLLDYLQTGMLQASANLLQANDSILFSKWGINLTVQ